MIHGNHGMKITTAVIGSVDTESVKQISKGVLDDFARESPDDVATAILSVSSSKVTSVRLTLTSLQGALSGKREVYYPLWETWPITTIRFYLPSLTDYLIRSNMKYRAASPV